MNWFFAVLLAALVAYLLGSVDFAIIISKVFYKDDIRAHGSGNAGMTNILRTYGKKAAFFTLAGDMGKGALAVWAGRWIFAAFLSGGEMFYGAYIAGICAILGHMFPLYFGFKGGKAVAVSGGVILALNAPLALFLIGMFLVITLISRMVSLGAIIGISLYPVTTLVYSLLISKENAVFTTLFAAIVAGLVVFMHRENIKRIRNGTERKIGEKKK